MKNELLTEKKEYYVNVYVVSTDYTLAPRRIYRFLSNEGYYSNSLQGTKAKRLAFDKRERVQKDHPNIFSLKKMQECLIEVLIQPEMGKTFVDVSEEELLMECENHEKSRQWD